MHPLTRVRTESYLDMSNTPEDESDSFQVQLLDENGKFNHQLGPTLDTWYKTHKQRDFYLVSVMGAQSSGKSVIYYFSNSCF